MRAMKPIVLFSVLAAIAVGIAASFGVGMGTGTPDILLQLPESVRGSALFVCPAADSTFDELSRNLLHFGTEITMVFFFCLMLLIASFGWAIYQNLAKDKFEKKRYDFPIAFGQTLLWMTIVVAVLMYSPNSFRAVGVRGVPEKFILCESNTPGARPVRADMIIVRSRMGQ